MSKNVSADFQTPPEVCEYMVKLIPFGGIETVLEPTPGKGNLVRAIESVGYDVTAPKDFFQLKRGRFDCIVMNPPFSVKYWNLKNADDDYSNFGVRMGYYFLQRCMMISDNIIAIMPWFTLTDSDVRLRDIKSFGLISLTSLPRKTFEYSRIQTVVLQLQKGYAGATEFKVFDLL